MLDGIWRTVSEGLSIASVVLVIAAVWITITTPAASGYEVSIYRAYPAVFWLLIIGALLTGYAVILIEAFDRTPEGGLWRYAFLSTVLAQAVLLFVPIMRGYVLYGRADPLTHLGYMKSILEFGDFGGQNVYPALHTLGLTVSYSTGLPLRSMINLLPPVFSLFGLIAAFVLVDQLFDGRRRLFGLPFLAILLFGGGHLLFVPYIMSTLLLPFVVFLYLKYRTARESRGYLVLIVTIVAIVVYHPLTTLFLMLIFGLAWVVERPSNPSPVSFNIIVIGASLFGIWNFGFIGILKKISFAIYSLAYSGGGSDLQKYGSVIERTSPSLVDLAQVAFFRHGNFLMLSVVAGLFFLYLINRLVRTGEFSRFEAWFFGLAYLAFSGLSVVFFINDLIATFRRPLVYATFFAAAVSGLFFGLLESWGQRGALRKGVYGVAVVSIVVIVIVSTFSMYNSPITRSQNSQTTEMEIEGMQWVFDHRNPRLGIIELGQKQARHYHIQYGRRVGPPSYPVQNLDRYPVGPPPHLGYANGSTFGAMYPADTSRYFLVSEHNRVFYPEIYPGYQRFWQYTPADYHRLERDPTVRHDYDNGGLDVYTVRGSNATAT